MEGSKEFEIHMAKITTERIGEHLRHIDFLGEIAANKPDPVDLKRYFNACNILLFNISPVVDDTMITKIETLRKYIYTDLHKIVGEEKKRTLENAMKLLASCQKMHNLMICGLQDHKFLFKISANKKKGLDVGFFDGKEFGTLEEKGEANAIA